MKIFLIVIFLYSAVFANIATITLLRGEATIKRGNVVLDAKIGDAIEQGDQLDTYKKSKMQVIFKDDTIITLGSNTKYVVDEYSNDFKKPKMKMTLMKGFLRTVTGKIGKIAPENFKLKTKSATIGIRGTGWKTYVGANIENSVCFKGEITIKTPTKFFELPAGNMILMSDNEAKIHKTNMKFFNAQIKKSEASLKPKEKVKIKDVKIKSKNQQVNDTVITKEKKVQPLSVSTIDFKEKEINSNQEKQQPQVVYIDNSYNEPEVTKYEEIALETSTEEVLEETKDEVIQTVLKEEVKDVVPFVITSEANIEELAKEEASLSNGP